jgi:hypothetical protein
MLRFAAHVKERYFTPLSLRKNLWWRMTGSNRRPSACKADALPAELILPVYHCPYLKGPLLIYQFFNNMSTHKW